MLENKENPINNFNYKESISYGEAKIKARENMVVTDGIAILDMKEHKQKMSKKEAARYYTNKINQYYKNRKDEVEVKTEKKQIKIPFKITRKINIKYKVKQCG